MGKRKIVILIVIVLILAAVTVIDIKSAIKREQELEEIAGTIAENPVMSQIIETIAYRPSTEGLQFVVNFTEHFAQASILEQYGYLKAYMIKLREYLNASEFNSSWGQEDIVLYSSNLEHEYKYVSACWDKEVKSSEYNGTYYVDGKTAYTSMQFEARKKKYISKLQEEYYNGYSDMEIMKYTIRVFKLVTCGGKELTLNKDGVKIANEVTERYGITKEEFSQIYRKYFIAFY